MRLGIDLGGTKIEIIALDYKDNIYQQCYRKRIATPQGNYQQTIEAIRVLVNEAESKLKIKGSLGIGIPGAISLKTGLVKNANSTCLIGQPLQSDLENLLERKIRINNDANCMTISEATDGAGQSGNIIFGVILGTGTGGGLAINKKVISGQNMIAGEWGHNPLPWPKDFDKPIINCYCGKQNCIETYLSGPGLLSRYHLSMGKNNSGKGSGKGSGKDNSGKATIAIATTVQELLIQAKQGNQLAKQAIEHYQSQLARALASVINIVDPDIIVLAGGLSNINSLYGNVPLLWGDYIFSDQVTTQLLAAAHGDSSGVRGAAWLW